MVDHMAVHNILGAGCDGRLDQRHKRMGEHEGHALVDIRHDSRLDRWNIHGSIQTI